MNKKLISLLMTGAMVGAVGTSAYASGVTTTPTSKVPTTQTNTSTATTSATTKTSAATTATAKPATSTTASVATTATKEHKAPREGVNYGWIKAQLEAGKTVSQIKATLVSNFNTKTNDLVSSKKITQEQATKREQAFAKHMEKHDILKGVIANGQVKKDLDAGKTLAQAESSLISSKEVTINKNLSAKKITQEQATKRIDIVKKEVAKGHDVFINEGMVHKIREQVDAGKTLDQAKQAITTEANAHLESLVKSGKIKSENLSKIEKHVDAKIDHNPAFNHVSNVGWIQKALKDGQTATQIKATFDSKLTQKEAKVETNKNLSQTQISKIKTHIENLQKAISTKSIFSNIMGNR
ncbi:MAG: hypothetical protein ACRCWG_03945 [Sarcina sp.]